MTKTTTSSTITVHVPLTFAIRGGRKTIIFDSVVPTPQRRTDNALLKAVARAYRWRRQIESGEYSSITELARAQKVNESYACRLLRLTLLAPAIIANILEGQQGFDLTLHRIARPLPLLWSEQRAVLSKRL